MPLKSLDATVSSFESVFEKFKAEAPQNKANLILFLADKDPSTNLSWCPVARNLCAFCCKRRDRPILSRQERLDSTGNGVDRRGQRAYSLVTLMSGVLLESLFENCHFFHLLFVIFLPMKEAIFLSVLCHSYAVSLVTVSMLCHPDCVRAEPVIYKQLEASPDDIALLKAYVGDRPTWRNRAHPWRVDLRFKLTGVPTLICWENGVVKGRLEDHEAHVEHKIDALVSGN